jgi:hypothetical protein
MILLCSINLIAQTKADSLKYNQLIDQREAKRNAIIKNEAIIYEMKEQNVILTKDFEKLDLLVTHQKEIIELKKNKEVKK